MQLGFVGVGRMGGDMARRVLDTGLHKVVAFDCDPTATQALASEGARSASSLEELVAQLPPPRIVWLMLPPGEPTERMVDNTAVILDAGDVLVDGGNTDWRVDASRADRLARLGVHYVDVGTSGGVWGRGLGYCLMVGGTGEAIRRLSPLLDVLAASTGPESQARLGDRAWAHVGPVGAGHFVKMIHNAVEYGFMQALAEGFELCHAAPYEFEHATIAYLWSHGSVVRSWLCELAARAFEQEGNALADVVGYVEDSGQGRWATEAALEYRMPVPVLTSALFARFSSRDGGDYSSRLIAALRGQFGGHEVRRSEGEPP